MKKYDEKQVVEQFLTKFYDLCATTDAFNLTLDEFYSEFPVEMHSFLQKLAKNIQNEVKNG